MFNMINGDFYRLKHSRGFYLTESILVIFVLATVLTGTLTSVSARPSSSAFFNFQMATNGWGSSQAVKLMTSMCSVLVYLTLPLLVMTTGFEFSTGSYKNLLSSGMSRVNYFISKYTVFIAVVLLQYILYYGLIFFVAGFKYHFSPLTGTFVLKMGQTVLFQLLLTLGIFSVAILVMFLTFSITAAVITTLVWQFAVATLRMIFVHATWLKFFDFQGTLDTTYFIQLSPLDWGRYLLTAGGTIVLGGLLTLYIFKHKNL